MRILMVNCHTAYVHMLAYTGHEIFCLNVGGRGAWDARNRPKPDNVTLLDNSMNVSQAMLLGQKFFDRIIMQDSLMNDKEGLPDFADRLAFERYDCKKIMLFHNSFQTQFRTIQPTMWPKVMEVLKKKLEGVKCVFISDMKKGSWGMEGAVIKPGIYVDDWGGWNGNYNVALTCVNNFAFRDFMNNHILSSMVCADKKWTVIGDGEGQVGQAQNIEQYKQILRDHRFYLSMNNPRFEDGYNLSMLEFMCTGGCPVVLDNPSSPIESGINGFKSGSCNELNKFLHECDYETAMKYGRAARETIREKFSIEDFMYNWNEVLEMP